MDEMVCQESQGLTEFMAAVVWMVCLDLTECPGTPAYPVPTVGMVTREYKANEDRLDLRESVVCLGPVGGRERKECCIFFFTQVPAPSRDQTEK